MAKSWMPAAAAVLMVANLLACLDLCAVEAEMAPSPSPDSAPSGQVHEETNVFVKLLDIKGIDLDPSENNLVVLQKYMDRLEASVGGAGFRFGKMVWDLTPRELGFKLGVLFTQAALKCTIVTRSSGDPSRPIPGIPSFIREKLHLQLSGNEFTANIALPPSQHGL